MDIRQKSLFEHCLELSTKQICVLNFNYRKDWRKNLLPEQREIFDSTHLYFICKKPKFNFIPGTLWYDQDMLQIGFELSRASTPLKQIGGINNYRYHLNNPAAFSLDEFYKSKLIIHYPNNSSITIPIEYIFPLFDSMICNDFSKFPIHDIMDYEILYIGQSVGRTKKSNALIRTVKGHHKLKIINEYISKHEPHYEIFIIVATIQPPYNISFSGHKRFIDKYTKNNSLQDLKNLTESHNIKKIVDLMEASLIKYFEPKYNEKLKDTPILGTELFIKKYIEDYDINTVLTVIDTSKLHYVKLCSPTIKANNLHKIYNTIHKENNRLTIGDIIKM